MTRKSESIRQLAWGFLGAALFTSLFHAAPAVAQNVKEFIVRLQDTSPGTQQTGHSNISGTAKAGFFVGNGGGLTDINADMLDGFDNTAFLRSIPNPLFLSSSDPYTISGTTTSAGFNVAGVVGSATSGSGATNGVYGVTDSTAGTGVSGKAMKNSGINYGVRGESPSPLGNGVFGLASSGTGYNHGLHGASYSTGGVGVFGEATTATGTNYGGVFHSASNNGFGVHATGRVGMYGEGDGYGVEGLTNGNSGAGTAGYALSTTGVTYGGIFTARSPDGFGIHSRNLATSGFAYGGYFESASTNGRAVYGLSTNASSGVGVNGRSDAPSGIGVLGHVTSISGTPYGVQGEANSPDGQGVRGLNFGNSGEAVGVFGYSNSGPAGIAIWGNSVGSIGVYGQVVGSSGTNYGVYGRTNSTAGRGIIGEATATSGTNYGVRGATSSGSGYGVYSNGNFGASGTKAFRIDHPTDPLHQYLLHYSSESPFPQNFYNGNVVTDAKGLAWVELPSYFSEINANFKYQLTVIDDNGSDGFVLAKVNKKIVGNRFQIKTSVPHVEVSWMVFADRNDLFVRTYRPKDLVEKSDEERGKYQHPELYGESSAAGMERQPPKDRTPRRMR